MTVTERMAVVTRRVTASQLAGQLRAAITRFNRRLRQTRPMGELTQNQISVLSSLELAGALTPRELSDDQRVQPPTMTKVLAKQEERGLIQRSPHPTDGRQVLLSATASGRAELLEQRRVADEWLTRRLTGLPAEDRETLERAAEILDRIARESD